MNKEQEQNFHINQCEQCFQNAWGIISNILVENEKIKKIPNYKNALISPAFRFALIEYAKPYTTSKGTYKRYKLDDTHVPAEYMELHKTIINSRHQKQAHHDICV